MSFVDSAVQLLEKTEATLQSLITDAVKAKAYGEIMTIAAMAQSVAAITPGHEGRRSTAPEVGVGVGVATPSASAAEPAPQPSWMRRREP